MHKRVLFICKRGGIYGGVYGETGGVPQSSGLRNSAGFVVEMLLANGVEAKLVEVTDNNDIDREVTAFRPTHVIIEALWVVPSKFTVLRRLHPAVEWVVRIHSEIPFLANEGSAMGWILEYLEMGIEAAPNSRRALAALLELVPSADGLLRYLPNYYPRGLRPRKPIRPSNGAVEIGCFGAIRPLKNQLIQAIAAIGFARSRGLYLHADGARGQPGAQKHLRAVRRQSARRAGNAPMVQSPGVYPAGAADGRGDAGELLGNFQRRGRRLRGALDPARRLPGNLLGDTGVSSRADEPRVYRANARDRLRQPTRGATDR
jgi:hypothetical protein